MNKEKEDLIRVLQRLFDWKYNSLAAYALAAQPYVAPGKEGLIEILSGIAKSDKEAADEIARMIGQLKGIPHVNPPVQDIAELNYLAVDYLASQVSKNLEEQVSFIREARTRLRGECDQLLVDMERSAEEMKRELDKSPQE